MADNPSDPRLKLFITRELLELRSRLEHVFRSGRYLPLEVHGIRADHAVAFARAATQAEGEDVAVLVVVPRLLCRLLRQSAGASAIGAAVQQDAYFGKRYLGRYGGRGAGVAGAGNV